LRTLFILLAVVGATLYCDGRLIQELDQQHQLQAEKKWIRALVKVLMWVSPLLCTAAVFSWILWRDACCYYATISGLSLMLPAAVLMRILFEGKKAQTKTV